MSMDNNQSLREYMQQRLRRPDIIPIPTLDEINGMLGTPQPDRMTSDTGNWIQMRGVDPVRHTATEQIPYAEYAENCKPSEIERLYEEVRMLGKRVKALEDERKPGQRFLQKQKPQ